LSKADSFVVDNGKVKVTSTQESDARVGCIVRHRKRCIDLRRIYDESRMAVNHAWQSSTVKDNRSELQR
jgi:hypothetical protein